MNWLKYETKTVFSILQFPIVCHLESFPSTLHVTGLWLPVPRQKYMTMKNWKHLGGGFPWLFTEPKHSYSWFPMISVHRTKKLFSMGFEILGLERDSKIYCLAKPIGHFMSYLFREGKEMYKNAWFAVLLSKAIVF